MHPIHLKERLHSPKKEHCLSCPSCLKVAPHFLKESDTPLKESQLHYNWKGTPVNGRTCFTHKFAHPQRLHPLNGKFHIPKEYCVGLSYKQFFE